MSSYSADEQHLVANAPVTIPQSTRSSLLLTKSFSLQTLLSLFHSLTRSSLLLIKSFSLQRSCCCSTVSLALLCCWQRASLCKRSCRCSTVSLALLCCWWRPSRSRLPCLSCDKVSEASALCCWRRALSHSLRLLNLISLCSAVSSARHCLSHWQYCHCP